MKYRKKPVVVEAVQLDRATIEAHLFDSAPLPRGVQLSSASTFPPERRITYAHFYVVTIHLQRTTVAEGDWIIAEPDGEHFYPCKPDIFAETYEAVSDRADKLAALKDKFASMERSALASGEQTPDVCPCVKCRELRAAIAECAE